MSNDSTNWSKHYPKQNNNSTKILIKNKNDQISISESIVSKNISNAKPYS
jgi:hypothetical protein